MTFNPASIYDAKIRAKAGSDFPKLVKDLADLGVVKYVYFVQTGIIDYYSSKGLEFSTSQNPVLLSVSSEPTDTEQLISVVKDHQAGIIGFPLFRKQTANLGIAYWVVDISNRVCLYYNSKKELLFRETIPHM